MILAYRINHLLVPFRYRMKPLSLVLLAASQSFCLSCLSSPSVHRWLASDNYPPPVTVLISSALPCWKLRYLFFYDVTGFRRPSPATLIDISLRVPMMGERVFAFTKIIRGNVFTESFSPLPRTCLPCRTWPVVEISTLIGLNAPLRCKYPGDISLRFCWSC